MRPIPQNLPGKGRKTAVINAILEKIREMQIIDSPTVRSEKRPNGTTLKSLGVGTAGGDSENVWQ